MGDLHPLDLSVAGLERLAQPLQETEHVCRWRQEKVAKIVQYGLPLCEVFICSGLGSSASRKALFTFFVTRVSLVAFGQPLTHLAIALNNEGSTMPYEEEVAKKFEEASRELAEAMSARRDLTAPAPSTDAIALTVVAPHMFSVRKAR